MSNRVTTTNDIEFSTPVIVAKGDSEKIRLLLYGTSATIGSDTITVIDPDGIVTAITGLFRQMQGLPFTFITVFDTEFRFSKAGAYLFVYHETTTGDAIVSTTFCTQWASRIDVPVSDFNKLRTEVSRVRTTIKKGA